MVDIYRGMPAIYASYTGYDEIAHHFGADSQEALRALRGLDKQIRQIDRMRQALSAARVRPLHPVGPRHDAVGAVPAGLRADLAGSSSPPTPGRSRTQRRGRRRERRRCRKPGCTFCWTRSGGWRPGLGRHCSARVLRSHPPAPGGAPAAEPGAEWDLSRRGDIAVRNSGSLSHVYFEVTPRPMNLSEVALLYPGLLEALVAHEGIGLVVGREGEQVVLRRAVRHAVDWPPRHPVGGGKSAGLPARSRVGCRSRWRGWRAFPTPAI